VPWTDALLAGVVEQVRRAYPGAQRRRNRVLSKFAAPVSRPSQSASFHLVAGAGEQAGYLAECLQSFVMAERDLAEDLGWQPPPAAKIQVTLAGRGDPAWSLEPDETKF
jgi:hypothetical protein